MTIEEEFYKTFGIEIQEKSYCSKGYCIRKPSAIKFSDCKICRNCEKGHFYIVPEITDRILLELICILNKHYSEHYQIASMIVGKNIEEVKKSILNDCIEQSKHKDFKQQVQALFGG